MTASSLFFEKFGLIGPVNGYLIWDGPDLLEERVDRGFRSVR